MDTQFTLDAPLRAVGELLDYEGESAAIVVVGGVAVNMLGFVNRTTMDVDVIALGVLEGTDKPTKIRSPDQLPVCLEAAVERVARDFSLPADWLNTVVGKQWETGLPPGLEKRVSWRKLGGLWVGLPDRIDIVFLKLYAAADDVGPASKHFKDLKALIPTATELESAAEWIFTQDTSPAMKEMVSKVINHVSQITE